MLVALSSIPVEVKLVCVPDTSAASKFVKALAFNAGKSPVNLEDARVQAVANATWTSAVKTAYQEMIDAQEL